MVTKYEVSDGGFQGTVVLAHEYDALKAEFDALAAENAALKAKAEELRHRAFNGRQNSHNCGPFQYNALCESIISLTAG